MGDRKGKLVMSNEANDTAGTALAAFTMAQNALWHLMEAGLVPKDEVVKLLKRGIEGAGNANAAAKLTAVLKASEDFDFKPPRKH